MKDKVFKTSMKKVVKFYERLLKINQMKRYALFMDRKTLYNKDFRSSQTDLQIQCNSNHVEKKRPSKMKIKVEIHAILEIKIILKL